MCDLLLLFSTLMTTLEGKYNFFPLLLDVKKPRHIEYLSKLLSGIWSVYLYLLLIENKKGKQLGHLTKVPTIKRRGTLEILFETKHLISTNRCN